MPSDGWKSRSRNCWTKICNTAAMACTARLRAERRQFADAGEMRLRAGRWRCASQATGKIFRFSRNTVWSGNQIDNTGDRRWSPIQPEHQFNQARYNRRSCPLVIDNDRNATYIANRPSLMGTTMHVIGFILIVLMVYWIASRATGSKGAGVGAAAVTGVALLMLNTDHHQHHRHQDWS